VKGYGKLCFAYTQNTLTQKQTAKNTQETIKTMLFVTESTVHHTVCHKLGLNIPNVCGTCNLIVPLHRPTGENLKYK